MTSYQSALYPTPNCIAQFTIPTDPIGFQSVLLYPASFCQCRLKWNDSLRGLCKTSWFPSSSQYFSWNYKAFASEFVLECTDLAPVLDQPTEWSSLTCMSYKEGTDPASTSAAIPNKYSEKTEKPLKTPLPFKATIQPASSPASTVFFQEDEGYITRSGSRISYEELAQLNAGSITRGAAIDYNTEPSFIESIAQTSQNIAFMAAFKNIQFLTDTVEF